MPLPVLERARDEMTALPGVGMSVMELSHRSQPYDEIHQAAKANLRKLLDVPDGVSVILPFILSGFLQIYIHIVSLLLSDAMDQVSS